MQPMKQHNVWLLLQRELSSVLPVFTLRGLLLALLGPLVAYCFTRFPYEYIQTGHAWGDNSINKLLTFICLLAGAFIFFYGAVFITALERKDPSKHHWVLPQLFTPTAMLGVVLGMVWLHRANPNSFGVSDFTLYLVALLGLGAAVALQLLLQLIHLRDHVDVTPLMPGVVLLAGSILYPYLMSKPGRYLNPTDWSNPLVRTQDLAHLITAWHWMAALALANICMVLALRIARWPVPVTQPQAQPEQPTAQAQHVAQPVAQQVQATPNPETLREFVAVRARYTFKSILGYAEFKRSLADAGNAWRDEKKNGILLHGAPGGGKTLMAEALAGELGLPIIAVNVGDMASKWINETTQRLKLLFDRARQQAPCVLFIDEIDALLRDRESMKGIGYEEHERIVATFLAAAVALRSQSVLLVAATNLIKRLDPAAIREGRFDFKLEVPLPDAVARHELINEGLRCYGSSIDDDTLQRLVRRWAGFNVPRIREVTERACKLGRTQVIGSGGKQNNASVALSYDTFYRALRDVQGRRGGAPEGAKRLQSMHMDATQRIQIQRLATQLMKVDEIERRGGTLPKGIVFYGPPGTGKTATAMALAAECGWTFIVRNGRDLTSENAIDALRKEASELRPAIVFIDEADDILGERSYSSNKSATNELLTLIDGAAGMLVDVVWIAATNSIESMDSAALRGGRFEQKLLFGAPSPEPLRAMLREWAQSRHAFVGDDADAWVEMAAEVLQGQTISNVQAVLKLAVNHAITAAMENHTSQQCVTREYLIAAHNEIVLK